MKVQKIGLKIVDLIHNITQQGYHVEFGKDFDGMLRITYYAAKPWMTKTHDTHEHLGFPACDRLNLEKAIIGSLSDFLSKVTS